MNTEAQSRTNRTNTGIILPTLLAVGLFVISIFAVIIPAFKSNIMDRKREMIRELTNSAWSVLLEYAEEEKNGNLSREEAQKRAISDIRFLRYGEERKDYFWITDMHPRMIIHPYKPQLEGEDLSGKAGEDPTGKKLFVEMVEVCKKNRSGYVEYMWQWKDDPTRIVPKLSYVKHFAPWDWIIGTGIYIEDVKEEIAGMTGRLIRISTAIIFLIALLLFYITRQSLKIEKQRQLAEKSLQVSEKKYRALVEAATEGTMMVIEGRYIYANQPILDMLAYSNEEFKNLDLYDIMAADNADNQTGYEYFQALMQDKQAPTQFEAQLKKKNNDPVDVELTVSKISLGDEKGFVIMARDIGRHKQMEEELDQSREKYKTLRNNLDIGVYRTTTGRKGKFIEANPAAVKILGFQSKEELFEISIFDLFQDKDQRLNITEELLREGFVRDRVLEYKKKDGTQATLSISCVLVKDESGENRYCDGIVEDITERKKIEESRENLIIELQTAQLFFNRSIKHFLKEEVTRCSMNLSIRKAAAVMSKNNYSAILVTADESETGNGKEDKENPRFIGIITDHDLRRRVVAEGIDTHRPVYEVMSSPLVVVADTALIFEAMLLMQEKGVRHLAVKDHSGKIISLINDRQLLHMQRNSSAYLIKEIHEAESVEDIVTTNNRLPRLVKALIDSGANSKNICRILTAVSDAVVERLIGFALEELGPPPTAFAFIALGSEGREEQTLKTDQDNAIIYEDITDPQKEKQAKDYFSKLGKKYACGWTNADIYCAKGISWLKIPNGASPFPDGKSTLTAGLMPPAPRICWR
jgi:PAS domain S-box-containing protein